MNFSLRRTFNLRQLRLPIFIKSIYFYRKIIYNIFKLNSKGANMKKIKYYTLENFDGHIYCSTSTLKLAKKFCKEFSNEGICYKRIVGKNCKKFKFVWI